jgi:hypothetical protein
MPALYVTIWLALWLFAAGEMGRARAAARIGWPWHASATGLALAIVHTLLSFDLVHGWSHDDAVLNTAMQTDAVFGVAVGAGVYVNYVFFAVWLADLAWWRRAGGVHQRSRGLTLALHAFYLLIIVNAAVVFAVGWRRLLGTALVVMLLAAWRRGSNEKIGVDAQL